MSLLLNTATTANATRTLRNFIVKFPILATSLMYVVRYGIGDSSVQKTSGLPFDRQRFRTFLTFGGSIGLFLGACYTRIYPRCITVWGTSPYTMAFFDVLVQSPLVYFPLFYITQETVYNQRSFPDAEIISSALSRYSDNFYEDMVRLCGFWTPVLFVNFRFVPVPYRGIFMGFTGIFWAALLSKHNGDNENNQKPPTKKVVNSTKTN